MKYLLTSQVEQKSIELEGTRARLRQLERQGSTTEGPASKKAGEKEASHQELGSRLGHDNYVKFGPVLEQRQAQGGSEPRVTFDLGSAKKTKIVETPSAKVALAVELNNKRQSGSQLPSDAKQRLQEMAGYDVKRNYRKSSSGDPPRPSRLNLTGGGGGGKYLQAAAISPPASPLKSQSPAFTAPELANHKLSRPSLTRKDSRSSQLNSAKSSLLTNNSNSSNNNNNNNNINRPKSGRESLSRQLVSPVTNTNGHQRTRTPSVERSLTSIKEAEAREASKVRGRSFWGGWWKFS